MKKMDHLGVETRCVHAGVEPEPVTGAIMTPIFQTSTYAQPSPGKDLGYDYSRGGNPTRKSLELAMADLENAAHAFSFSSGMAAEQAVIQVLEPGDRVIVSEDTYGGTGRLFRRVFARYGLEFAFIDLTNLETLKATINDKTRLIWIETPTNPLLQIVDIAAISAIAHESGAKVLVDNTFCSPIIQSPLALGADIVLHSTTKYIGGHSDLVGGVVMTNDTAIAEQLKFLQMATGPVNSPFECFLLLRSIKTLALRMAKHSSNGMAFARALEACPKVDRVIYPGLESHPQHEIARKQMRGGFSGIVSVYVPGDFDRVCRFVTGLKLISLAESLGGVESLVNHPETMTHASVPPEMRQKLGINANLVRFSMGIESADDLIADVMQALDRA